MTNDSGLNKQVLRGVKTLLDDKFVDLVDKFVVSCDAFVRDLHDAIDRRDYKTAKVCVHSLKSSSASLGLMELSRLAVRVEDTIDAILDGQAKPDAKLLLDIKTLEAAYLRGKGMVLRETRL